MTKLLLSQVIAVAKSSDIVLMVLDASKVSMPVFPVTSFFFMKIC